MKKRTFAVTIMILIFGLHYQPTASPIWPVESTDSQKPLASDQENWGAALQGFQVSLRIEKPAFTNGEPISAIVKVRNVGREPITFAFGPHSS